MGLISRVSSRTYRQKKMSRKRAHVSSSDSDSDNGKANKMSNSVSSDSEEDEKIEVGTDETISQSSSEISASDPEKFPDGYDKDCIGDDDDREKLNDMPEIERESELYRRMELREDLQNKAKIEKKLKRTPPKKKKKKKKKKK